MGLFGLRHLGIFDFSQNFMMCPVKQEEDYKGKAGTRRNRNALYLPDVSKSHI